MTWKKKEDQNDWHYRTLQREAGDQAHVEGSAYFAVVLWRGAPLMSLDVLESP
jgi:hypothetical protein